MDNKVILGTIYSKEDKDFVSIGVMEVWEVNWFAKMYTMGTKVVNARKTSLETWEQVFNILRDFGSFKNSEVLWVSSIYITDDIWEKIHELIKIRSK